MILKGITYPKTRTSKGYNGSRDPFYQTPRWKKDSKHHLSVYPLCVICKQQGKITPATVSDHITPINQGGDVWDWKNRQGLCKHHHAVKSALENTNNQY